MQEIKLIALDMDGTLLRTDKSLSAENKRALELAAEKGIEIVPATGRFYGGIPEEIKEMPFVRYAITINGAAVFDIQRKAAVYAAEITKEQAMRIFEILDGYDLIYDCYQDNAGWMTETMHKRLPEFVTDPYLLDMISKRRTPVKDLKETVAEKNSGIQKIQFFSSADVREEAKKRIAEEFPELRMTSSIPNNLEINNPNADKGTALRKLAEYLGMEIENTMAFGDGENDITMLQAAGCPVCMENSAPVVKAQGFAMTEDCDSDGVARALKRFGVI